MFDKIKNVATLRKVEEVKAIIIFFPLLYNNKSERCLKKHEGWVWFIQWHITSLWVI